MKKNKMRYNTPINLINSDNKSSIHLFTVHLSGAKKMALHFGDIQLPAGAYVELADKARKYVYTYTFAGLTEYSLAMFSDTVSIKVVLPKSFNCDEKPSLKLISAEDVSQTDKSVLELPDLNWEAYKCYSGTEIGVHALTSALCGATAIRSDGSSCSLIGSGNYVLTNRHVVWTDHQLDSEEMWFNYFNESCDLNSIPVEPVRIAGGKILKTGGTDNDNPLDGIDYTLFTLNEFDYRNAHVKTLFGGLKIADNNAALGDIVYEPHYGAAHPMIISAKDSRGDECCVIISGSKYDEITNCPIVSGASGSPILSKETNELVILCALGDWDTPYRSSGPTAQLLNEELGGVLGEDNIAVKPEGKVISWNVEVSPVGYATIHVDLGEHGRMSPFETVILEDFDDYSVIEVESLDLTSNEINHMKFKVEVETENGTTHLSDDSLSGKVAVHIKPYETDLQRVNQTVSRSWFPLRVEDEGEILANHLTRIAYSIFDPFEIPFDINDAEVIDLLIDPNEVTSITKEISGSTSKGSCFYIALYTGEGPENWDEFEFPEEGAYSIVKTMLKNEAGNKVNINLRGQRLLKYNGKNRITIMNHMLPKDSTIPSSLILSYYPEDNPHVDFKKGLAGVIPLQGIAIDSNSGTYINILARVTLTGDSV